MARMAGQDPALTGLVLEVAAQAPVFRDKVTKVVLINNLVKETNNRSPVIRVIRSS